MQKCRVLFSFFAAGFRHEGGICTREEQDPRANTQTQGKQQEAPPVHGGGTLSSR